MSMDDRYGNALHTTSDVARRHYDTGLDLFLGANYGAVGAFESAVAHDPDLVRGHAGLARARMMSGDMAGAKVSVAQAQQRAATSDMKDQAHVEIFALLIEGKADAARAHIRAHVRDHPHDVLVAQACTSVFGLIGFSGKVGREAELLAYSAELMPHYREDWWLMSMHALALCETGQIAESHDLMARSLALYPRNANAAHFKAHAHYEAGETEAGRAYLRDWLPEYDARSLIHGHLTWHAALWALQDGDVDAMWAAVDAGVGPDTGSGLPLNVLTDTAAILYRAQLAGVDVAPERWAALSDYAAQFFPDTGQSFADIHAALSHAMAGNGARLARIAEGAKGFAGDLVAPVAQAWGAMARGQWQVALEKLAPAMAQSERLGGSRAQRDLIELAYVSTLLKLGQRAEANRSLALRRPGLARPVPVASLH